MVIDFKKLWNVCEKIHEKEHKIGSNNPLLGKLSTYEKMDFDSFIEVHSFKIIGDDTICVYKNDFSYSYVPLFTLDFKEKELSKWIDYKLNLLNRTPVFQKVVAS